MPRNSIYSAVPSSTFAGSSCLFLLGLFVCGLFINFTHGPQETGFILIMLFVNSLGIMAAITKVFVVAAIVVTIAKHSGVWPQRLVN